MKHRSLKSTIRDICIYVICICYRWFCEISHVDRSVPLDYLCNVESNELFMPLQGSAATHKILSSTHVRGTIRLYTTHKVRYLSATPRDKIQNSRNTGVPSVKIGVCRGYPCVCNGRFLTVLPTCVGAGVVWYRASEKGTKWQQLRTDAPHKGKYTQNWFKRKSALSELSIHRAAIDRNCSHPGSDLKDTCVDAQG